ncbi:MULTISPECIES: hypothetical protein, partial [Bacteroides]|uniref:hypothetical protein n=1 Tax=Bacteroides TaxID=816 RepID=UPI001E467218
HLDKVTKSPVKPSENSEGCFLPLFLVDETANTYLRTNNSCRTITYEFHGSKESNIGKVGSGAEEAPFIRQARANGKGTRLESR